MDITFCKTIDDEPMIIYEHDDIEVKEVFLFSYGILFHGIECLPLKGIPVI